MNKILSWFYTTWLGNLYFEVLLWNDRRKSKTDVRYLTPKEISTIVRQYSLLGEGVTEVKRSINRIVQSKTKEEYDAILKEIEDLTVLAEGDPDSPKAKFAETLRSMGSFSKLKDIENDTDRAKMLERRINDMKELQAHREKRNALRAKRKENECQKK